MKRVFIYIIAAITLLSACKDDVSYNITVEYEKNLGTVSPEGVVSVKEGDSQTFTITPIEGAYIDKLLIDDIEIDPIESYTFSNVIADHKLLVEFKAANAVLLCNLDWILNAWTVKATYNGVTQILDLYNNPTAFNVQICTLDDLINFDTVGSFTNKPGLISCEVNYGLLGNGDWAFITNETILSLKPYVPAGTEPIVDNYTIDIISESSLIISLLVPVNVAAGVFVDGTMTYSFRH